jgi:hypothetical protein
MQSGPATINFLQIEYKKITISFEKKVTNDYNKSICLQTMQSVEATINLMQIELQKKIINYFYESYK